MNEFLEMLAGGDLRSEGRAAEVAARSHPELLAPLAPDLLRVAGEETVAQARRHLAETFGRLPLDREQADRAVAILLTYLEDKSRIVTYCAVQALGILGRECPRSPEIATALRRHQNDSKSIGRAAVHALAALEGTGSPGDPRP